MSIIMSTRKLLLVAAIAVTTFTACTVKDVDTPPLAGPSSLARTIIMVADRDTLLQDGTSEAAITLRAQVQPGQSENVRLRAQVFVDGVAQDFGTLSNKNPITPTTIFFRAPAAPPTAAGQEATTVTIAVTPDDSGDFRSETTRTLDLRLIPPGVILPTNPTLEVDFDFNPKPPDLKVGDIVTFDASLTKNRGVTCGQACTYNWNFGDGTTGTGIFTTHQYRTVGTVQVTLTVTDSRGAQAVRIKTIRIDVPAEPEVDFTFSPTTPAPGQQVFFNASASKPEPGRTLVSYAWNFGDGTTGTGVNESHVFSDEGTYTVTLRVTDDVGAFAQVTKEVTVARPTAPGAAAIRP
jgi:chitodextrinase